ncbi:MAG: hypothetical protein HN826_13445 [Methylococcales bacterium]|jgi:flagellar hook-length control protein FliK|nr:hypothetical protein [Methylococcales bacterium]
MFDATNTPLNSLFDTGGVINQNTNPTKTQANDNNHFNSMMRQENNNIKQAERNNHENDRSIKQKKEADNLKQKKQAETKKAVEESAKKTAAKDNDNWLLKQNPQLNELLKDPSLNEEVMVESDLSDKLKSPEESINQLLGQLPNAEKERLISFIKSNPDTSMEQLKKEFPELTEKVETLLSGITNKEQVGLIKEIKEIKFKPESNQASKLSFWETMAKSSDELNESTKEFFNKGGENLSGDDKSNKKDQLFNPVLFKNTLQNGIEKSLDKTTTDSQTGFQSILSRSMPLMNQQPQSAMSTQLNQTASDRQNYQLDEVKTPVGKPGWDKDLGAKLVTMVNKQVQTAEIRLNPLNLGPVKININMENDQAVVMFNAQHAQTREALEAAMPKLKSMFENEGIELKESEVSGQDFTAEDDTANPYSAQHFSQQQNNKQGHNEADIHERDPQEENSDETVVQSRSNLIIDEFA